MEKILDGEFKKELYKSLMEAGYDKREAQTIVGKKYYKALHEETVHEVDIFLNDVVKENFETSLNYENIQTKLSELKKLKELLENE